MDRTIRSVRSGMYHQPHYHGLCQKQMERMRIGSLFDGSGTAPLAATMLGWEPVWASEIEPFPVAVTRARFPDTKHLGSITEIDGAKVELVDVVVGGSPCQDLSIAGKQAGLEAGTRSNLFYEMTRIIREMRSATNGKYPRFVVWENVPGAFSSNQGRDFHEVVKAFCALADETVSIPEPQKDKRTDKLIWRNAGCIVGDGWSFAWRVLDAQYWGVPQRRRRIFAVLDLGSERAGEILFERTGVRGDIESGGAEGQGAAANAVGCAYRGAGDGCLTPWDVQSRRIFRADETWPALYGGEGGGHGYVLIPQDDGAGQGGGVRCLNPHDSQTMRVYDADGIYPALAANSGGGQNRQAVIYPVGAFCAGAAPAAGSIGYSEKVAPTLKAGQCAFHMGAVVYEPMSVKDENWAEADAKNALWAGASKSSHAVVYPVGAVGSLCARADSSPCIDRGQPFVAMFSGGQGEKAGSIGYSEDAAPTLRSTLAGGNAIPQTVYALQGNGIDRSMTAGCNGARWREGEMYTLNTIDRPAVVYDARGNGNGDVTATLTGDHENRITDYTNIACYAQDRVGQYSEGESASTQTARQHKSATDLVIEKRRRYIVRRLTPTECARLQGFPDWWVDGVPGSDTAKYKMWGNGMALPCLLAILRAVDQLDKEED